MSVGIRPSGNAVLNEALFEGDEGDDEANDPRPESGIALARSESRTRSDDDDSEREHDDSEDDEFMVVTLEEIELIDPPRSGLRRRARRHHRQSPRAAERWKRCGRAALQKRRPTETILPPTESLARRMAALVLVVGLLVVFRLASL